MKNLKRILLASVFLSPLVLTGCGEQYNVPPGYVAKIVQTNGVAKGVIKPSAGRLDTCWTICDKMILIEASDQPIEEKLEVFMPQDSLLLRVDIRGIVQINDDDKNAIDGIIDRIPAQFPWENKRFGRIDLEDVYKTYAQNVVRTTSRSVLIRYSISFVLQNPDKIASEISAELNRQMKESPIKFIQFGMSKISPPDVIIKAQEAAQERRIGIERAEADKEIALRKAQADYEIAEKDRAVRLLRARTTKEENDIIASSVTPAWIQSRYFEVMERMAAQPGQQTIFFPYEVMQAPGLQNRIMNPGQGPTK